MKKQVFSIIIVFLIAQTAISFDPIGIPGCDLNEDQGKISLEYTYSELDIHADSSTDLGYGSATIKNIDIEKYTVNFGWGLTDDIEIFLRTGFNLIDPDNSDNDNNVGGKIGKSKESFVFGGGLKFNIYKQEKFSWGLTTQTSWSKVGFKDKFFKAVDIETETKIDVFEIQIATGPAYELFDNVTIYGGPFFHFINGEVEMTDKQAGAKTTTKDNILNEDSIIGAFGGTQIKLTQKSFFNIEGLFNNAGWALAGGVIWMF